MTKRIIAIGFVFCCATVAWFILGATVQLRTHHQDRKLKAAVGQLWGIAQTQRAPQVYWIDKVALPQEDAEQNQPLRTLERKQFLPVAGSQVHVGLQLEHRRKGLLWYATYRVDFAATYQIENRSGQSRELFFDFALPTTEAVYDDFTLSVGDVEFLSPQISSGRLIHALRLQPGERQSVRVSYRSQGLDEWRYSFGDQVNQVENFTLAASTDFDEIDFPEQTISPTHEERTAEGWQLKWQYDHLLTGVDLGVVMPRRLNPGPWVSQVCFAAPVSLLLFFFLLFIFTTVKGIRVHPVNFFFIAAAFFCFHLLLAYLVDHISIHVAFLVGSLVSVFLVVSYMRLVVGPRFACVEVGLSQLVYQVLFSYTFFFTGYTGLTITILCIVTLFAVMQFTGRLDWEQVFRPPGSTPEK